MKIISKAVAAYRTKKERKEILNLYKKYINLEIKKQYEDGYFNAAIKRPSYWLSWYGFDRTIISDSEAYNILANRGYEVEVNDCDYFKVSWED